MGSINSTWNGGGGTKIGAEVWDWGLLMGRGTEEFDTLKLQLQVFPFSQVLLNDLRGEGTVKYAASLLFRNYPEASHS